MFSVDATFCGQKFTSTEGKLLKLLTENVTSSQLAASWFGLFGNCTVYDSCILLLLHRSSEAVQRSEI